MELSKDDLELTLKELKGQRINSLISLEVLEGSIAHIQEKLLSMPDVKHDKEKIKGNAAPPRRKSDYVG